MSMVTSVKLDSLSSKLSLTPDYNPLSLSA